MRIVVIILMVLLSGCEISSSPTQYYKQAPPRDMNPVVLAKGKAVYDKHCKRCHGVDGVGSKNWRVQRPDGTYPAPPLNGSGHTWHHPKTILIRVIKEGSPGGMGNMPSFINKVNDEEIDAIIKWAQSLWDEAAYQDWYQRDASYN